MKYVLASLLLFACGQEPSKKPAPVPNVPPQEQPKPQPTPPESPWPIPDFPGGGWPFPIPGGDGNGWPSPVPLPPSEGGDGGGTPITDKETYLRFHNLKRCWHNVGNVIWNEQLAARAQAHADRCVFAHDATANAGENLAIGYGSGMQGLISAMDAWYLEVKSYRGDWSLQTGHFSQMVWKGSNELGCGSAECPSGRLVVCRYLPQGNVLGQFKENVLPLRSDLSQCQ